MTYIRFLLYFNCILLLLNSNATNSESIAGRYVNTTEKNAVHYIDMFDDGTFVHYYSKDTLEAAEKAMDTKLFSRKWIYDNIFDFSDDKKMQIFNDIV